MGLILCRDGLLPPHCCVLTTSAQDLRFWGGLSAFKTTAGLVRAFLRGPLGRRTLRDIFPVETGITFDS
jgi:hypothetical protein